MACCRALERDALASDPRFATNAGRVRERAPVVSAVGEALRTRSAAEWLARFAAVGVPAGIVRLVSEALADVAADPLTGVAPSLPGRVRLPPPTLDQHGALIRRRGWTAFDEMPD
jgi:crotonobetainyl-CoA:carnitine CoA-transferase CaiB-like acyl-CoA transferase